MMKNNNLTKKTGRHLLQLPSPRPSRGRFGQGGRRKLMLMAGPHLTSGMGHGVDDEDYNAGRAFVCHQWRQ